MVAINANVPGAGGGFGGIVLDPAQRRFFVDDARVQAVCWHRQKGKDFCTAAKAVLHAMQTGQDWFIVSLTQRQADATFAKCRDWASRYKQRIGEILVEQNEDRPYYEYDAELDQMFEHRARELRLPNGGRVVSLPGRDPDTLAGLTGNVIFTEFGLFPRGGYDHWRVIFPLATRGFFVIAISTPRGKDHKFFEIVSDSGTYSVHFCDIHQSMAEGFVLRDQMGEPTDLATFKRLYGDDIGFQREYECEFLGALDALIKWAQIEAAGRAGRDKPFDLIEITREAGWDPRCFDALGRLSQGLGGAGGSGGRPEMGWDVARRGHLSALWINEGQSDIKHLRHLVVMRDCSFALQREIVTTAMNTHPQSVGCGDATGLGMDSNETLATMFPESWEPVNFGGKRKSDLGSGLATAFRDQSQTIPPLDGPYKFVATDLYAVQRNADGETDGQGKTQLKLVESENPLLPESHCDIAYAGALALRAGHMTAMAEPSITLLGGFDRRRWGR